MARHLLSLSRNYNNLLNKNILVARSNILNGENSLGSKWSLEILNTYIDIYLMKPGYKGIDLIQMGSDKKRKSTFLVAIGDMVFELTKEDFIELKKKHSNIYNQIHNYYQDFANTYELFDDNEVNQQYIAFAENIRYQKEAKKTK